MKSLLSLLTFGLLAATASPASAADTRLFEMRVYYAAEGKLDALNARFRDHTLKLFTKHGMTNLGYFVPTKNTDNKLVYFLAYADRAARDASWKAFGADPAWKSAQKASEVNGKLITKVESAFLTATDYAVLAEAKSYGKGVFELRTYTTEAGRLENLNSRFRDHTLKLFEKHGMTNMTYWNLAADQKGAKNSYVAEQHPHLPAPPPERSGSQGQLRRLPRRPDLGRRQGKPLRRRPAARSRSPSPTA
jgi:hypothetical protein